MIARMTGKDYTFNRWWNIRDGYGQEYRRPWQVGPFQTPTGTRGDGVRTAKLVPLTHP